MKKVVSMFMALVMAFTMGPVVVARAEDEWVGDECRLESDVPNTMNSTNSTGFAWCKENPKDCAAYAGETAWNGTKLVAVKALNGTKLVAVKAWDGTKLVGEKFWDETAWVRGKILDGAADAWVAAHNYNLTQLGEKMKWCAHNAGDCVISVYVAPKKWLGNRVDEVDALKDSLESLYDYDMKDDAKWPFWAMVSLAAYQGASVALSAIKFIGKVAYGTVKLGGKFVMILLNPCFKAKVPHSE